MADIRIEVAQSPEDGMYYASADFPNGDNYRSPPCKTEGEAEMFKEICLQKVLEIFGPQVKTVHRSKPEPIN